jgi:hypothetical protein
VRSDAGETDIASLDNRARGNADGTERWQSLLSRLRAFLDEEVPEYDADTGTQVGTRTRGRAIATNPFTVGALGAAAFFGGEALLGALGIGAEATGAGAAAEGTVTIADAAALLPKGVNQAQFGRLAGFSQGLTASSQASTEATGEVIANLKTAGITREAISAFQRFYAAEAIKNPNNLSAIQRSALLENILKAMK